MKSVWMRESFTPSSASVLPAPPTIATALKAQGYATGQFGKNHLGDRDEFLPTAHGFDEFFGNLYHLNAEEEPENVDYPKDPEFRKKFGPRGVLHTYANADGTQRIEDTGPLTKKRMETCDEEFRDAAIDFIKRQNDAETPFFVWFNSTHMHFRTHPKPESIGRAGRWQSEYHDTMLDHDEIVGELLDTLDELGIADNTIVMYSTDNGPHMNSWPDAGMTPFRNEKNSNWEGAYRVPADGALARTHPRRKRPERDRQPQRLVRHPACGSRRTKHRRETAQGNRSERHDIQGAPRRAQPIALHHR